MDYKALLLSARGRIGRKTYWLTAIGLAVVSLVLQGLSWTTMSPTMGDDRVLHMSVGTGGSLVLLVLFAVTLVIAFAGLMLAIKRCHDRDRSGWFLLVTLIPFVGPIWLLVELGFLRGTVGPNRFGADPVGGMAQVSYAA